MSTLSLSQSMICLAVSPGGNMKKGDVQLLCNCLRTSFALLKGDTLSDGVDQTCVPKHVYGILLTVLQGQAQG